MCSSGCLRRWSILGVIDVPRWLEGSVTPRTISTPLTLNPIHPPHHNLLYNNTAFLLFLRLSIPLQLKSPPFLSAPTNLSHDAVKDHSRVLVEWPRSRPGCGRDDGRVDPCGVAQEAVRDVVGQLDYAAVEEWILLNATSELLTTGSILVMGKSTHALWRGEE